MSGKEAEEMERNGIEWRGNLEAALEEGNAQRRFLLIDFSKEH